MVLSIFQRLSGLQVNLRKSEILVTSENGNKASALAAILGCKASNFPITYLGLPLSDKRLTR
jgi:hypothetical protein